MNPNLVIAAVEATLPELCDCPAGDIREDDQHAAECASQPVRAALALGGPARLRCTQCHQTKPLSEFYRGKRMCKPCVPIYRKNLEMRKARAA